MAAVTVTCVTPAREEGNACALLNAACGMTGNRNESLLVDHICIN